MCVISHCLYATNIANQPLEPAAALFARNEVFNDLFCSSTYEPVASLNDVPSDVNVLLPLIDRRNISVTWASRCASNDRSSSISMSRVCRALNAACCSSVFCMIDIAPSVAIETGAFFNLPFLDQNVIRSGDGRPYAA